MSFRASPFHPTKLRTGPPELQSAYVRLAPFILLESIWTVPSVSMFQAALFGTFSFWLACPGVHFLWEGNYCLVGWVNV